MAWVSAAGLGLVLLAVVSIFISTVLYHAPPWPSSARMRRAVVSLVLSQDHKSVIYEAGAGWGGLALALAQSCPRSRVIAAEVSIVPFTVCWLRSLRQNNLHVVWQDAAALVSAETPDILVTYVTAPVMQRLSRARRVEQGMAWVSIHFSVPNAHPVVVEQVRDLWQTPVYLYHFKRAKHD